MSQEPSSQAALIITWRVLFIICPRQALLAEVKSNSGGRGACRNISTVPKLKFACDGENHDGELLVPHTLGKSKDHNFREALKALSSSLVALLDKLARAAGLAYWCPTSTALFDKGPHVLVADMFHLVYVLGDGGGA